MSIRIHLGDNLTLEDFEQMEKRYARAVDDLSQKIQVLRNRMTGNRKILQAIKRQKKELIERLENA